MSHNDDFEGKAFSRKNNYGKKRKDKKFIKDINKEHRVDKLNKKEKQQEYEEEKYSEYFSKWQEDER
jgi:hypothetical protein